MILETQNDLHAHKTDLFAGSQKQIALEGQLAEFISTLQKCIRSNTQLDARVEEMQLRKADKAKTTETIDQMLEAHRKLVAKVDEVRNQNLTLENYCQIYQPIV